MPGTSIAHLLVLAFLRLHIHFPPHHFHGSPIDYSTLAAGAAASFFGIPGPGEPLLIAAGILAARHKLDIAEVVLIAFVGANAGGVGGWLLGKLGGRTVLTTRGPFRQLRLKALARGDDLFARHSVIAVLLTPSWIAGIHQLSARRFILINAASALVWAAGIGIGAFYAGPAVIDWVGDLGWITGGGLAALVIVSLAVAWVTRHRKARSPAGD